MGGHGYATSAVRRVIGIARDVDAAADGARPFQSANFARRWPTPREVPVTFISINPTKPCLVAGRHVLARCPAKASVRGASVTMKTETEAASGGLLSRIASGMTSLAGITTAVATIMTSVTAGLGV